MAALDEAAKGRLIGWAGAVSDNIFRELERLPEGMRYPGLASLVLALIGEMIWRSDDAEAEAAQLKLTVDAAVEMLPTIEDRLAALVLGSMRASGNG